MSRSEFRGPAGILAAFAGVRLLESVLWGVPRTVVLTFAVVGAGVLVLALMATLAPALRAARLEPSSVLKG